MTQTETLVLRSAHITLEALLKATGAALGGEAKQLIAAGSVQVNGDPETRRGRKLRSGDRVAVAGRAFEVLGPDLPSGLGV